jgi:hypothetical protein
MPQWPMPTVPCDCEAGMLYEQPWHPIRRLHTSEAHAGAPNANACTAAAGSRVRTCTASSACSRPEWTVAALERSPCYSTTAPQRYSATALQHHGAAGSSRSCAADNERTLRTDCGALSGAERSHGIARVSQLHRRLGRSHSEHGWAVPQSAHGRIPQRRRPSNGRSAPAHTCVPAPVGIRSRST